MAFSQALERANALKRATNNHGHLLPGLAAALVANTHDPVALQPIVDALATVDADPMTAPRASDADEAARQARGRVRRDAERARLAQTGATPGDGKGLEYVGKSIEALMLKYLQPLHATDPDLAPTAARYPLLAAVIAAGDVPASDDIKADLTAAAEFILARFHDCRRLAALVNLPERQAVIAIDSGDPAAAETRFDAAIAALSDDD